MNYTNRVRKTIAFRNKVSVKHEKILKRVTAAAGDLKAKIKKTDNLMELEAVLEKSDLGFVFAEALSDIIIISYDAGHNNSREKSAKNGSQNFVSLDDFRKDPQNIFTAAEVDPNKLWEIDWSLEDKEALEAFKAEAFEVGEIVSTEMMEMMKEEASKALSDGVTFQEWRKSIQLKGFEAGNPYHLRTNFNTAINNSYLAATYIQAEKDSSLFPFIKYQAIMDDRVRDEHAALHGYIYPVNDSFWDENWPPNGWNCRCDVEQISKTEAEKDPMFGKKAPGVEIDDNFKKNAGKDKTIWGDWLEEKKSAS